jgi:hypothetical protein
MISVLRIVTLGLWRVDEVKLTVSELSQSVSARLERDGAVEGVVLDLLGHPVIQRPTKPGAYGGIDSAIERRRSGAHNPEMCAT